MPYPYPPPYPTLQKCPKCGLEQRLHAFRRWSDNSASAKRILFDVCNTCEPGPVPENERQLMNAVATERIALAEANTKLAKEARKAREKISNAQTVRRRREYRTAWNHAIFFPLRKEKTWAQQGAYTAAAGVAKAEKENDPLTADAYRAWGAFFDAYIRVLNLLVKRARLYQLKARTKHTPPTPEDVDFQSQLSAATIGSLRRLYSACPPIKGMRSFREPTMMLEWRASSAEGGI